jgi:hypothetical protein
MERLERIASRLTIAAPEGLTWRNHAEYLLACIDSCIEAGSPPDELDPEDVAEIDATRAALAASPPIPQQWQPIETAPKDGTLILLLVDYSGDNGNHWIDDSESGLGRTIGHNNDDEVLDGEGQGWQFAGWCWSHDHFVEGEGHAVKWQPLPDPPALARADAPKTVGGPQ